MNKDFGFVDLKLILQGTQAPLQGLYPFIINGLHFSSFKPWNMKWV